MRNNQNQRKLNVKPIKNKMETLHTPQQTEEIIAFKERINEFFDFIIELGQKELPDKPDLNDCTVKDCLEWNRKANVELMGSKTYSLRIEFNSKNELMSRTNEISYSQRKEVSKKEEQRLQNKQK